MLCLVLMAFKYIISKRSVFVLLYTYLLWLLFVYLKGKSFYKLNLSIDPLNLIVFFYNFVLICLPFHGND